VIVWSQTVGASAPNPVQRRLQITRGTAAQHANPMEMMEEEEEEDEERIDTNNGQTEEEEKKGLKEGPG